NNKTSSGLKGEYTVAEGLQQLLAGSGIRFRFSGENTVTLVRESDGVTTLPPVKVSAHIENNDGTATDAYRVKNTSVGVMGKKLLKDTPYSIEVYSHELMENKQARSLADIVKGDAAVSLMVDNLVTENLTLAIRGLSP